MWGQSRLSQPGQLRSVLRAVWRAPLTVLQKGQLGLFENELVIFSFSLCHLWNPGEETSGICSGGHQLHLQHLC